jgi:succinate dehydrogenase/fumarate reductase flavoprotein subunit
MTTIQRDVVVIGAGASGLTAATDWSERASLWPCSKLATG